MKRMHFVVLLAALMLLVNPLAASAATPSSPDLSVSSCTINISFDASAAVSYELQIWDDGVMIDQLVRTPAAAGDLVVFSKPYDPATFDTGAPGIGIYLYEGGSFVWAYDPFTALSDCEFGMGPDMSALPSQAVVGRFVATTTVLYAPDAAATTDTVIEAGKTLWVVGVDSPGGFYKVLLSGQAFWVPVSSMGPNFDDVWNGTPLPTTVVS